MLAKLQKEQAQQVGNTIYLVYLILILNCIEIASLGGVTYISNRENYRKFNKIDYIIGIYFNYVFINLAIHEKIFITFMICSLCHMLATIKLNDIIHKDHTELTQLQRDSIKWKKILFAMSILSTIGLLIFFAKHRFYCHDLGKFFKRIFNIIFIIIYKFC